MAAVYPRGPPARQGSSSIFESVDNKFDTAVRRTCAQPQLSVRIQLQRAFISLTVIPLSLVFIAAGPDDPPLELTHNWDQSEPYDGGRNFGHVAYAVDDIYAVCRRLADNGVTILRPPRDGRMAFVRSPDNISVELLQAGDALPITEPWASMTSQGEW